MLADYFTLAMPLSTLSQSWAADARFRSVHPYFQGKHQKERERPCIYIPALDAKCSAARCTCCAWDQQGMAHDTAGPSGFDDVVCGAHAGAWCSRSGSTDGLRSAETHRSQTFGFLVKHYFNLCRLQHRRPRMVALTGHVTPETLNTLHNIPHPCKLQQARAGQWPSLKPMCQAQTIMSHSSIHCTVASSPAKLITPTHLLPEAQGRA